MGISYSRLLWNPGLDVALETCGVAYGLNDTAHSDVVR